MSSPAENKSRKVAENQQPPREDDKTRERIRDIIIVFVTYPLTPTKKTEALAAKKPWLEFASLFLKVALAAYALYEGISGGS